MSLVDRLDALAREKQARIERLLAENAGLIRRASDLPALPSRDDRVLSVEELFPESARIGNGHGAVITCISTVPVTPAPDTSHPRGYRFAPAPDVRSHSPESLATALKFLSGNEAFCSISLDRIAFVDTETTGVSGATGTYPFLIGLGFFRLNGESLEGAEFVCEQYFMEDYCHEPAILAHFADRLAQFEAIVSYNGKTYDLPLLEARYILNRRRVRLDLPHLDLLNVTRRVYKPRLGACNLANIEREVLGIARTHDVPGHLIPQIYFDFLRGLGRERLVPVFDHNVQDIVTLGALLLLLAECAAAPGHPALGDAQDLAAFGRFHHRRRQYGPAAQFLEQAITVARDGGIANAALCDLANAYRRLGRIGDAAAIWRQEYARSGLRNPAAVIELMKILEHQLRDCEGALALVEDVYSQAALHRGLGAYNNSFHEPALDALLADLERRRERLAARRERRAKQKGGR